MSRPVPDEVWQRLDPRAGTLSPRTAARLRRALAAAVVLFIAGVVTWHSGLVVPHVVWGQHGWELHRSGLARMHVTVANAGWVAVTVLDVGRSAPGFELLRVDGGGPAENPEPNPFPVTLGPGEGVEASLVYRLSDCDSAARDDWPMTARTQRPWGVLTVEMGDEASPIRRWQEHLIDSWCDPRARSIS